VESKPTKCSPSKLTPNHKGIRANSGARRTGRAVKVQLISLECKQSIQVKGNCSACTLPPRHSKSPLHSPHAYVASPTAESNHRGRSPARMSPRWSARPPQRALKPVTVPRWSLVGQEALISYSFRLLLLLQGLPQFNCKLLLHRHQLQEVVSRGFETLSWILLRRLWPLILASTFLVHFCVIFVSRVSEFAEFARDFCGEGCWIGISEALKL